MMNMAIEGCIHGRNGNMNDVSVFVGMGGDLAFVAFVFRFVH